YYHWNVFQTFGFPISRISDLAHAAAGSRGKVELSMTEEPGEEDGLIGRIVGEAVMKVFDEYRQPKQYRALVEYFEGGETLTVGETRNSVVNGDYFYRL